MLHAIGLLLIEINEAANNAKIMLKNKHLEETGFLLVLFFGIASIKSYGFS